MSYFNKLLHISPKPFKEGKNEQDELAISITSTITLINEHKHPEGADVDDLAGALVAMFGKDMYVDIDKLIGLCAEKRISKIINLSRLIGKHSIDVIKISAGVAIGTAIHRQLNQSRK